MSILGPSELSSIDLLLQFSEESGEFIQAVAKLIRKERGTNPTPMTLEDCRQGLIEEAADVSVVLEALLEHWDVSSEDLERVKRTKDARWRERLSR